MLFAHRLCLEMGILDVDAARESVPAGTFQKWSVYAEMEPFGEQWRQVSSATAEIVNAIQIALSGFSDESVEDVKKRLHDLDYLVPKFVDVDEEDEAIEAKKQDSDRLLHLKLRRMTGV